MWRCHISQGGVLDIYDRQLLEEETADVFPSRDYLVPMIIDAFGGDDVITIDPDVQRTVWIDAGPGDDSVSIFSGDSNSMDVILGGDGNDTLAGGPGSDWIFGEAGDDWPTGGLDLGASDLMFGNEGNDVFQIIPDWRPAEVSLTDWLEGGFGEDYVLFIGGDSVDETDVRDHVAIRYNTVLHRYELTCLVWDTVGETFLTDPVTGELEQKFAYFGNRTIDIEHAVIDTRAGDDEVHADPDHMLGGDTWGIPEGDYQQRASLANLEIYGGLGDDSLFGGAGNDLIDGGGGDDVILGDQGDDTLEGGSDNDTLVGNRQAVALAPPPSGNATPDTAMYEFEFAPNGYILPASAVRQMKSM